MRGRAPFFWAIVAVFLCLSSPAMAYPDADLNCDNAVDVLDIQLSIYMALNLPFSPILDADQNGLIDDCGEPPMDLGCGPGTTMDEMGTQCVVSQAFYDAAFNDGIIAANEQAFTNCNLSNIDLAQSDLSDISLIGCNLSGIQLNNISVSSAQFQNADLSGANLNNTVFSDGQFVGADLSDANLNDTDFQNADLSYATIENADVYNTHFENAILVQFRAFNLGYQTSNLPPNWKIMGGYDKAFLVGPNANLSETSMIGFSMNQMKLMNINLAGSDLSGSYVINVDLTGANLEGAILVGTYLKQSNFTGANLLNANMEDSLLDNAIFSNTTCPDGTLSDDNGGTCCGHLNALPTSGCP